MDFLKKALIPWAIFAVAGLSLTVSSNVFLFAALFGTVTLTPDGIGMAIVMLLLGVLLSFMGGFLCGRISSFISIQKAGDRKRAELKEKGNAS